MSDDLLPADIWEKIKKTNALSNHRLEHDKAFIEQAIDFYRRTRTASKEDRRLVEQTRDAAAKTISLLTELVQNKAFLFVGAKDDGPVANSLETLARAAEGCSEIEREMEQTLIRFDHARDPLFFPQHGALEELAYDLLMTHATSLGTAPPTTRHQSTRNPGFVELVRLCVKAADDPNVNPDSEDGREKIDRAIDKATRDYAEIRKSDPVGWKRNWGG